MSGPVLAGLFAGAMFLAGLAVGRWLWGVRCPAVALERTWSLGRDNGRVTLELRHTVWRPAGRGERQGVFAATTFRLPSGFGEAVWAECLTDRDLLAEKTQGGLRLVAPVGGERAHAAE